jgi:hypothetical protein
MLYREIIAVCSEIHTKHISTLCGQNVELLNVKLAVHIVTTWLWSINAKFTQSVPIKTAIRRLTFQHVLYTIQLPHVTEAVASYPFTSQTPLIAKETKNPPNSLNSISLTPFHTIRFLTETPTVTLLCITLWYLVSTWAPLGSLPFFVKIRSCNILLLPAVRMLFFW